ncbi:MAG: hypothetical protein KDA44_00540 [Planctomycetales bacterium]|nr:hypothetical protein [Planctomycetales bacterium]
MAGVVGVATLAIAWYALSVRPSVASLDALWSEVESGYDYLATEANLNATLFDSQRENQRLQARFAERQSRVGSTAGEVEFLSWLSRQAADWDLAVDDYHPGGVIDYGDYRGYSLLLSGSGSYESICRMLGGLRRSERLNRVAAITMTSADAGRTVLSFTMRIELLTQSPETLAQREPQL